MAKLDDSRFFDAKRLKDLGDGIFAFAMTFLIVTIDIPRTSLPMLGNELNKMIPDILTYVLSFFLLAIFWITNHIQLKDIKSADGRLIWISILLFLLIVFVPLTTDLFALYEASFITAMVFHLNIFLIGLVFMLQWHHLVANNLHHEKFKPVEIQDRYRVCQMLMAVALIAIAVSMHYPLWSPLVYIIMFSYRMYIKFIWVKQEQGGKV